MSETKYSRLAAGHCIFAVEWKRSLEALAGRLFWWKTPAEALADRDRFLGQLMTYGTWGDIVEARAHWEESAFREALQHASPGVFDQRSWTYWHYVLDPLPVPPRPVRKFDNGV